MWYTLSMMKEGHKIFWNWVREHDEAVDKFKRNTELILSAMWDDDETLEKVKENARNRSINSSKSK